MSGNQAQIFLNGEGQAWLERNKNKLPISDDPVLESLGTNLLHPKKVLEVGCANGWRLIELEKKYKCLCTGIDPSVTHSQITGRVALHRGVASNLQLFNHNAFDLIIYGFCLYLCDPEDYFMIVKEGDRVLADGGHLVIYDFNLDAFVLPHSRTYAHRPGLRSHKMRFENLWKSHPAYTAVSQHLMGKGNDLTSVTVLKKDMRGAFPLRDG